tara:strand:- start:2840 stop:3367 length:528 start_codon:yes stop_codon:yes gene_type:complete
MNQFDDTSFDAPIPGMGMTHELGARPWQTPPTYTTVEETSDYYIERMSNPKFKEQLLDVMEMKIPLTTLANTIQLGSVMEGLHTVDVGMLMIPILVETMALIGDSSDVDYITGMDDVKADRPAMTSRIISDLQDKQNLDSDVSMEEPMAEDMPMEESIDKEMPMEEPKGLMARRV